MIESVLEKLAKAGEGTLDEYTPMPFWFFNDDFDREKVRKQLEDYCAKGVNGFVLHPRIGIPKELEYLSEEYFDAVEYIVDTAAELGMKVALYDEGMYPSGSAHGEVVRLHPEYASVGLILRDKPEGLQEIARTKSGKYLMMDYTGGNIRGIHFGEDDGEAGAPPSADILNPDAVDLFIELTHERYYRRLSQYFGNVIIAFFTDEPCVTGRNTEQFRDWTRGLEEELVREGGVLSDLEGLFTGEENQTTVLCRSLVRKRLVNVFYTKLSDWCESHNIHLMGHPEKSNDMDEEMLFGIPGQDLIMRRVCRESGGLTEFDSVQAKCSADMARLLDRKRNANECFGVCVRENIPWYMTAADMKWMIDWLGIRGVNLFVPHAFYYSVREARSGERPPDVGPNNIWWPCYRQFSDYMKRISYLQSEFTGCARIAVLVNHNRLPYAEVACLFERQQEFMYLPLSLKDRCRREKGKLAIGSFVFDEVINFAGEEGREAFPDICMSGSPEEAKSRDIICLKPAPAQEETVWPESLRETEEKGLRAAHLRKNGLDLYLLLAEQPLPDEGRLLLSLPESGRIAVMDLWTGQLEDPCCRVEGDRLLLSLTLPEGTMKLVAVESTGENLAESSLAQTEELAAAGLSLKPEEKSLGDLTEKFAEITGDEAKALQESLGSVPGGHPENTRLYRMILDCASVSEGECFSVRAEEMTECWCNGQFAGAGFWNPHRFFIGGVLVPGKNELIIRVTGNAANIYAPALMPGGMKEKIPFGLGK